MPQPRKTLIELVEGQTFVARKHKDRLLEAPLERPDLRTLQGKYFAAQLDYERAVIAVEFERAVRRPPPSDRPTLTLRQMLYAATGPGVEHADELGLRRRNGEIDFDGLNALERRWQAWDRRYGTNWRYLRGHPNNVDVLRMARRLGLRTNVIPDAERLLERRRADVDEILAGANPSDPPAFERLR